MVITLLRLAHYAYNLTNRYICSIRTFNEDSIAVSMKTKPVAGGWLEDSLHLVRSVEDLETLLVHKV
jgi:hypothetical protein